MKTTDPARFTAGDRARVTPPAPPAPDFAGESLDRWGFDDSRLYVNERGHIAMTGARYPISGHEMPDFLPWMQGKLGVTLDPNDRCPSAYPPAVPPPRENPALVAALREFLAPEQLSTDDAQRLRHGHGHTQFEVYAIRHAALERVPDLVCYPTSEEQVVRLVEAARRHDACVIPYGGGTSVTQALLCPAGEARTIVSVDMRRMNRVLWIDKTSRMACIEAGAVGRDIASALARYGYTLGHEPDSSEFSTLGGWVATHASGMKKNRYGNIEDVVLDVRVVTADGVVSQSAAHPRESTGYDVRAWVFGSEGTLGIVTSAVVKITPLPEVERYGSLLFKSFEDGVAFLYDLAQHGQLPASVRLMDNVQFQFGQVLKPARRGVARIKSKLEKSLVTGVLGFDADRMVACTLLFEGSPSEVRVQEEDVYRRAKAFGGFKGGEENGRRGYMLTYSIAYIRDLALDHHILAESFETSVPWGQALSLCENVKRRVSEEHARRGVPGRPFISCRVTQLYPTGCCVYFYYAFYFKGVDDPSRVYDEIEAAARDEILKSGGSLSHHHGVGKLRQRFLPEVKSRAALSLIERARRAADPGNVFGSANQSPPEASPNPGAHEPTG